MSSSSSSSSSPRWIYDLFINFRGVDTRKTFVSHLYAALSKEGIDTFLDDKKLVKGGKLRPELERAIEGSHVSIVVFSKNYTKSSWCLDELVQIMECQRTYGQVVIPIFYNIDPAVVRHQKGAFGKGLKDTARKRYLKRGMRKEDLLCKWGSALIEAVDHNGWDADNFRDDAQLVEQIVEEVLKKLDIPLLSSTDFPVGLDSFFSIIRYISLCGYQGSSHDVFSSLIWSWMSQTMSSLPRIPTSRGISRLQLSVENNNMGLGYLLTGLSNLSKLRRSVQVQCHSEVQLTRELRRFLFDLYDANFTKLETSQISDLSLKTLLIGMGSYHMVINTLERSISQGLAGNGSSDFILPGNNYPSWLTYTCKGPSVLFQVPEDGNCGMKGIALCVVYSSTPEKMATECFISVLIINYTKFTIQICKRDTVMSFNDEDWQGVISNLGIGDNVEIFVAFGHAMTVKETAVYLIYDQSLPREIETSNDVKMEPSHEVNAQPSPNLQIEPSSEEEVQLSPNVKMEPSLNVKKEPSPTPYEIFASLVRRLVEYCLCLD